MYEKYSTRGVSRGRYSTGLRLVLYLPLNTPPRAVFPVHTRGSALTHTCGITLMLVSTILISSINLVFKLSNYF